MPADVTTAARRARAAEREQREDDELQCEREPRHRRRPFVQQPRHPRVEAYGPRGHPDCHGTHCLPIHPRGRMDLEQAGEGVTHRCRSIRSEARPAQHFLRSEVHRADQQEGPEDVRVAWLEALSAVREGLVRRTLGQQHRDGDEPCSPRATAGEGHRQHQGKNAVALHAHRCHEPEQSVRQVYGPPLLVERRLQVVVEQPAIR